MHVFYLLNFPNVVQLSKSAAFFLSSRKKKQKKTKSDEVEKGTFKKKNKKNQKNLSDFLHIYLSFT